MSQNVTISGSDLPHGDHQTIRAGIRMSRNVIAIGLETITGLAISA